MYATVRSYGPSDLVAQLRQHQDAVKSLMGTVSGFQAYYIVETSDGGAVSVTVCDDQAGAEESNAVAAGWIRENLAAPRFLRRRSAPARSRSASPRSYESAC